MKEFKGTKGIWTAEEHSWSDTSLMCGDKTIATMSIYDDATEETQEELENEVSANFRLLAAAPDLLELCQFSLQSLEQDGRGETIAATQLRSTINRALGIKE